MIIWSFWTTAISTTRFTGVFLDFEKGALAAKARAILAPTKDISPVRFSLNLSRYSKA